MAPKAALRPFQISALSSAEPGRATWTLHLRTADGRHSDTVVARRDAGYLGFGGYDVAGDLVAWSFAASAADPHIYIYNINTGATTALVADGADNPQIRHGSIIWTEASAEPARPATWRVRTYDPAGGIQSPAVEQSSAKHIRVIVFEPTGNIDQ